MKKGFNSSRDKKVVILMSTYNGEKYLKEQLESIFSQTLSNIELLVRDDGSNDNTLSILEHYASIHNNMSYYKGENLGPAYSFLELIGNAPAADYYALADQDDYWMADKLSSAISALQSYDNNSSLYFCQTQLADKELNKIESVIIDPFLTFGEALVYEFVGGCTMVFNSKLRDIIKKYPPSYLPMHDVWIYDIALAVGAKVVFDPTPHMLYRQHNNNVVGQSISKYAEWRKRIESFFLGNHNSRSLMAKELYKGYGSDILLDNLETLKSFIDAKSSVYKRFKLLFDKRFLCSNNKTYRLFKLSVILNTY